MTAGVARERSCMAKATPRKRVVVPSRSSEVMKVQQTIMDEVQRYDYGEKASFGIQLALDEALANAVNHGNCGDPSRTVTVEYLVTSKGLEVSVTDEGCGFAPNRVPDPTLDENLEKPGGRGVMLMKAYMDEVHFNKTGNCVILRKRRE